MSRPWQPCCGSDPRHSLVGGLQSSSSAFEASLLLQRRSHLRLGLRPRQLLQLVQSNHRTVVGKRQGCGLRCLAAMTLDVLSHRTKLLQPLLLALPRLFRECHASLRRPRHYPLALLLRRPLLPPPPPRLLLLPRLRLRRCRLERRPFTMQPSCATCCITHPTEPPSMRRRGRSWLSTAQACGLALRGSTLGRPQATSHQRLLLLRRRQRCRLRRHRYVPPRPMARQRRCLHGLPLPRTLLRPHSRPRRRLAHP